MAVAHNIGIAVDHAKCAGELVSQVRLDHDGVNDSMTL